MSASISTADGALRLQGELTLAWVPQLYRDGSQLLQHASGTVTMDLSGVTRADSSGLALLIEWLAVASQRGQALRYAALPPAIQALARLSEVQAFLVPAES